MTIEKLVEHLNKKVEKSDKLLLDFTFLKFAENADKLTSDPIPLVQSLSKEIVAHMPFDCTVNSLRLIGTGMLAISPAYLLFVVIAAYFQGTRLAAEEAKLEELFNLFNLEA